MSKLETPTSAICSVDECNWPAKLSGLCWSHYCQSQFTPESIEQKQKRILCSFEDCDQKSHLKGYCSKHYYLYIKKLIKIEPKKFERAEYIKHLQKAASVFGSDLSVEQYTKYQRANGGPVLQTFKDHFNNWSEAKESARLKLDETNS